MIKLHVNNYKYPAVATDGGGAGDDNDEFNLC